MKKNELMKKLAAHSGLSVGDVDVFLSALGLVAMEALRGGGELSLPHIGRLCVKGRAARSARNPATGAMIDIPAKRVPHFSPAKSLKDIVN